MFEPVARPRARPLPTPGQLFGAMASTISCKNPRFPRGFLDLLVDDVDYSHMKLVNALGLEPAVPGRVPQVKPLGRPRLSKVAIQAVAAALSDANSQIPDADWPSCYVGELGKFTKNQTAGEQCDVLQDAWRDSDWTKMDIVTWRGCAAKVKNTERADREMAQWREAKMVKEAHDQFRQRLWSPDGMSPFEENENAEVINIMVDKDKGAAQSS